MSSPNVENVIFDVLLEMISNGVAISLNNIFASRETTKHEINNLKNISTTFSVCSLLLQLYLHIHVTKKRYSHH